MSGIERIAAERRRQVEAEGWTPEHDDQHAEGELAAAATAYTFYVQAQVSFFPVTPPEFLSKLMMAVKVHALGIWPESWSREWFKPSPDPIRNLEKAGALIAAEIDRQLWLLERAARGEG